MKDSKQAQKDMRAEKRAAALRDNLKRRKMQQKERGSDTDKAAEKKDGGDE